MLSHARGKFITTDVATKQLIMYLNEENGRQIVLKDLDDTHIMVDARYLTYIKTEVAKLLEQNVYILPSKS